MCGYDESTTNDTHETRSHGEFISVSFLYAEISSSFLQLKFSFQYLLENVLWNKNIVHSTTIDISDITAIWLSFHRYAHLINIYDIYIEEIKRQCEKGRKNHRYSIEYLFFLLLLLYI